MNEPRKRTNAELWEAIENLSGEAELARINALDDPELDRELRAAGIDPDKAAAFVQKAIATAPSEPRAPSAPQPSPAGPHTPPPRRSGWVTYFAAAAVAVLAATALTKPDANTGSPAPPDSSASGDDAQRKPAAQLRAQAFEACAQSQWKRCAILLDEARLIDPAGDADPRVVRWREAIRGSSRGP
jgi:hypothetical protein